ncbi:MAG: alpha/beta fold hydrolase [Actinomycetes bacterium]
MADVMLEDTRIHHLDLGLPDADVILLLHAFPLRAAMWDEQLRWFGERHRAIAVDLKGFGGTRDAATPGEATANASSSNGSASKATFSC